MQLLEKANTGILIIDIQEKLMAVMGQKQRVTDNVIRLLELSKIFGLSVLFTEQYPEWLGPTLPEIVKTPPSYKTISKMHFNCCDVEGFNEALTSLDLKNLIVVGVETHICVFQTCVSLLEQGYKVHVPQDAVTSRTDENWQVGLRLMERAGALITSTETIIYQVMKKAGTPEFKEMLKVIK